MNATYHARREHIIRVMGEDFQNAPNNELRYCCPFCEEQGKTFDDYKLYVSITKGIYYCQRCESTGKITFDSLLMKGSNSDVYRIFDDVLNGLIQEDEDGELSYEDSDYFLIPLGVPRVGTLAWEYLLSRGISEQDIQYYNIRVSDSPNDDRRFSGRFILPNQVIKSVWTDIYVARTYIDDEIRYKNPISSKKSRLIFNLHRIPQNPERIIINEGAINSIIAGRDSIATYGKHVSNKQIDMILSKNPDKIYVSLDTDAEDVAEKLCQRIRSRTDKPIYFVHLPENKDASDLGKEQYEYYLQSADSFSSGTSYFLENFIKNLE